MVPARTQLVRLNPGILSCYDSAGHVGGPREQLQRMARRQGGYATLDAAAALLALHLAVEAAGGELRLSDCYRDAATQAAARAGYEAWLAAERPAPSSPEWREHMKRAFVARPGRSFHGGGRAVDVDLARLRFPGVAAEEQLDALWELAQPIGWSPIIRRPDERASEAWHLDYLGEWAPVMARLGRYEEVAAAATLDLGVAEPYGARAQALALQGHLHRAGYHCGRIDGVPGSRTWAAAGAAGLPHDLKAALVAAVALPSSPETLWRP